MPARPPNVINAVETGPRAEIAVQMDDEALVWRGHGLLVAKDPNALQVARDEVLSWTREVFDSDEAAEYGKAVSERDRP